jgi:hypothetical protein
MQHRKNCQNETTELVVQINESRIFQPGFLFYAHMENINGEIVDLLDYRWRAKRDNSKDREFRSFDTAK